MVCGGKKWRKRASITHPYQYISTGLLLSYILHFQICNMSYTVSVCLKSQQTNQNSLSTILSAPYSHELKKLNIVTVRYVLLWYEKLCHRFLKSWNCVKHWNKTCLWNASKETKSFQKEKNDTTFVNICVYIGEPVKSCW